MKKINFIFITIAVLLTFSLMSFGARNMARGRQTLPEQQPNLLEQQQPLAVASLNPALVGLKAIKLFIPNIPMSLAGLGPSVKRKLADADPRLALLLKDSAAAGLTVTPTLTIIIVKLILTPNRPPVFSVQTTLTANVSVNSIDITTATFIETVVWSRADTIQSAGPNAELAAVASLVNKHIEELIADFIVAHSSAELTVEPNVTPADQTNINDTNNLQTTQDLQVQYPFVASKSQLIFHKIDCPLVKNILARNRIFFKTKEEAIAAGKKPCQRCKP